MRIAEWISTVPEWLEIREISEVPSDLLSLGSGEREAIALAQTVDVELVLLDEKRARNAARARGLAVSATLGVLDRAAARGLVAMTEALGLLEQTTFVLLANRCVGSMRSIPNR